MFKKVLLVLFVLGALQLLVGRYVFDIKPDPPEPKIEASPAAIEAAKKALQAEKQVAGVYYDPQEIYQWQIGMVNDGTSRVGYARYVCELLKEKKAFVPKTRVKIIDVANVLVPEKDRNMHGMGAVSCDDYSILSEGDLTPVTRSQ